MRRQLAGLSRASQPAEVPDGLYLVRVERAEYRYGGQKPFYAIRFRVIEPTPLADRTFTGRLYSTAKAMWKLSWFLVILATTQTFSDAMNWMKNVSPD